MSQEDYLRGRRDAFDEVFRAVRATSPEEAVLALARQQIDEQIRSAQPVSCHAAWFFRDPKGATSGDTSE